MRQLRTQSTFGSDKPCLVHLCIRSIICAAVLSQLQPGFVQHARGSVFVSRLCYGNMSSCPAHSPDKQALSYVMANRV